MNEKYIAFWSAIIIANVAIFTDNLILGAVWFLLAVILAFNKGNKRK